jgi:hypothetical protein
MKKVILIIALVVGLSSFAQGRKGEGKEKKSPEEQVEMIMKKMTSELTLTEKQQGELRPILMEQAKTREAKMLEFKGQKEKGTKPTDEQIAQMKKNRIDEELAMKTKLKKILTEEQYTQWSNNKKDRLTKMRSKGKRDGKPVENEE